ncbi:MAG: PKD-like family lipoprotein [Dysgonomonas sp.]|nr:PKD-like family lipoprotein [Dysgonomonas sp.]
MKIKYKIRYQIILGFAAMLLALPSCNDDKGNYSYEDLNEVSIEGINSTYTVEVGDQLKITPDLTFSISDKNGSFSYEWYVLTEDGSKKKQTMVSSERNLSLPVEGLIGKPGSYDMVYNITDNDTGVKYIKELKITVQSYRFAVGYMLLTEKPENKYDIDMLAVFNNQIFLQSDILSSTGSELPIEGNPLGVATFLDNYAPSPYETTARLRFSAYILSDKRTDRVKAEDFSYKEKYNLKETCIASRELFPNGVIAEKLISTGNNRAYMYANQNWYCYSSQGVIYLFDTPINSFSYGSSEFFKTSPYIFATPSNGAILYDLDKERFILQKYPILQNEAANPNNVLCSHILTDNPTDKFQFNNPDYELIYMGNKTALAGFAIVNNKTTNKAELLEFALTGLNSTVIKSSRTIFGDEATQALKEAKHFAYQSNAARPYLYFATEDKVYRTLTTSMVTTDVTSSVLTPGYKISKMKYMVYATATSKRGTILGLATYNPNGKVGENGKIQFLDTENNSGNLLPAKQPEKEIAGVKQVDMIYTGMGKIIDFDYKFQ